MADLRGYVTSAGQQFEALAKQMGYPIVIGMIEIGDGVLPDSESPITRTQLVNKLTSFPAIVEQDAKNPGQWVASIHIPADHAINGAGYFIREIGCKLINQGDGILYAYRRVSNDWKPVDTSGEAKSFIYKLRFIPGNGELLKPTIDPSVVLVNREELDRVMKAHKESRDHPAGTKTEKGMLRLATTEEAIAGSREDIAVAPKQVRDAMEALFDIICPIGQLIYYDGPTVPNERFIVYKAQAFDPARYPKLAKKWPSGRLPADLRSEFIRGADEGRGIVAGLLPMMSKPDQIRSHDHQVLRGFDRTDPGGGSYVREKEEMIIWGKGFSSVNPTYDHTVTSSWHSGVSLTGGPETNPRYVGALILCRCE